MTVKRVMNKNQLTYLHSIKLSAYNYILNGFQYVQITFTHIFTINRIVVHNA